MSDTKRIKCPQCGEENPRMMHEQADKKAKPLYYSMQGAPVYKKVVKCGRCGNIFDKP